jgi:hypothetical protein
MLAHGSSSCSDQSDPAIYRFTYHTMEDGDNALKVTQRAVAAVVGLSRNAGD